LDLLFGQLQGHEDNRSLIEAITETADALGTDLHSVVSGLERIPYPFDHAEANMTVQRYLMPRTPSARDVGGLYEAADQYLDRIADLYPRVASRLAVMAERVEQLLGLPPAEASAPTAATASQ
jgi:hypothetical protein